MNNNKVLSVIIFSFLFVILTNGLAFAERSCTRQVTHSDGTVTIDTSCSSSYTRTSEIIRNPNDLKSMVADLMDKVNRGIQNLRDRLANMTSSRESSQQFTSDIREKTQESIEAQRAKSQEQKIKLENLKDRQEDLRQQQADFMQDLKSKK
jgi:hypothetical protein